MSRTGIVVGLAAAVAAAIAAGAVYWKTSVRAPKQAALPAIAELQRVEGTHPQFDRALALPGSPQGIATNGIELIVGNRRDPWGVLRIRRTASGFTAEPVPILTPSWDQKMDVQTLTWNGTHYVGYTSASWFGRREGNVFTLHDPATLRVLKQIPAPSLLGCLAWDGTGYWAATRRNTRDADEPKKLYRLDARFNIVSESEAPGVGCQGAAWDGERLWLVDVFDDAIYVVDVSGSTPRLVHRAYADVEYLSGIVSFDRQLWIVDYGNDRLQRIRPSARLAWSRGETAPREREEVAQASVVAAPVVEKTPVHFARNINRFPDREPDDTDTLAFELELRGDGLYGSWTLWFGHDLFTRREQSSSVITLPQFARYELTVRNPDGSEVKKSFDAVPGENVMSGVRLADAKEPGEYRADIFMHVQYVTRDGAARILNNSGSSLQVRR